MARPVSEVGSIESVSVFAKEAGSGAAQGILAVAAL